MNGVVVFHPALKVDVSKPFYLLVIVINIYKQLYLLSFLSSTAVSHTLPYLWNQPLSSFHQPHSVHSPPGSAHPAHVISSQSSPSLL